eukprot:2635327-Prymnesium_polylepis.2
MHWVAPALADATDIGGVLVGVKERLAAAGDGGKLLQARARAPSSRLRSATAPLPHWPRPRARLPRSLDGSAWLHAWQ